MEITRHEPPLCRVCKEDRKRHVKMRLSPTECVSEWRKGLRTYRGGYSARVDRHGPETTVEIYPHRPAEAPPDAEQIGAVIQWRCPECKHGAIASQARCAGAEGEAHRT